MLEVQGIATDRNDAFPYSGIRVFGAIQLSIGIVLFCLGVIDLVITMTNYSEDLAKYGSEYELIVTLTVASSPLWCGMWFAITGSIGSCISRKRAHSLHFFKMAFLVLNIMCAALFGPVSAVLSAIVAIKRHDINPGHLQWLLSMLVCFISVLEIIMAVTSSSVVCCCSPLRSTQVHVIVNPPGRSNRGRDLPTTSTVLTPSDNLRSRDNNDNDDHHQNKGNHNDEQSNHRNNDTSLQEDNKDMRTPEERIRGQGQVDDVPPPSAVDGFGDSGGYPRLKKWALPGW